MIRSSADTAGSHDARLKELIDQSCCRHGDGNGHGYQGLTRYCDECGLNWPRGTNPRKHTTEALMVALRAEQPAWQPIETAPKDGTEIIVWWPHPVCSPVEISYYDSRFRWQSKRGGLHDTRHPTHWMPLPDPQRAGTVDELSRASATTSASAAPKSDVQS